MQAAAYLWMGSALVSFFVIRQTPAQHGAFYRGVGDQRISRFGMQRLWARPDKAPGHHVLAGTLTIRKALKHEGQFAAFGQARRGSHSIAAVDKAPEAWIASFIAD